MDKRNLLALTAAVAVLALIATTTAPAAAGALTSKTVRKIAAGVVKKKASHLTVARAKDADALGGRPPAAYTNQTYVYTLTASGPETLNEWTVSPPPGRYLATFATTATTTGAATSFTCYFGAPSQRQLRSPGTSSGNPWTTAGGGYIEITGATQFHCDVSGSATSVVMPATDHGASQVVLTRLDEVTAATLTAP
jgi:hypothetical protein